MPTDAKPLDDRDVNDLIETLTAIEWAGREGVDCCPFCRHDREEGHRRGCGVDLGLQVLRADQEAKAKC